MLSVSVSFNDIDQPTIVVRLVGESETERGTELDTAYNSKGLRKGRALG